MRNADKKQGTNARNLARRTPTATTVRSLASRLKLRDHFFRNQINPRQLLEAFDHI